MKRLISLSLLSLGLLLAPAALFARWGGGFGNFGCDMMFNRFYHGGWIMGIIWILLLAVLIFFGIRIIKGGN